MNNRWLLQYLGKPFEFGKSGPYSYDCWGLVRAVYNEQFNIYIPNIESYPDQYHKSISSTIQQHCRNSRWTRVKNEKNLDIVLFSRKNRLYSLPEHIGIFLSEKSSNFILHSVQGGGVSCEEIERLSQRGLNIYGCYRYTPKDKEIKP